MRAAIHRARMLAWAWELLGGLLLGGGVGLVIVLVPENGFSLACVWVLVATLVYVQQLAILARQQRGKRRFLEGLPRSQAEAMTAPVAAAPGSALALLPGQRVTLHYRLPWSHLVRLVAVYGLRLLVVTVAFEFLLTSLTPEALPTALSSVGGVPLPVQWLILLMPPLLWLLLALRALGNQLLANRQTLLVDDWGIIRQRPGRTERLAWSQIGACARVLFTTSDQVLGSYLLWDAEHYLEVPFLPLNVQVGRRRREAYAYGPAFPAYRTVAEQVLATILVRSGVPLQAVGRLYYSKGGTYQSAALGMATQEVLHLPEAPLAYQPSPEALAWAHTYGGAYTLPVSQTLPMTQPVGGADRFLYRLWRAGLLFFASLIVAVVTVPTFGWSFALFVCGLLILPAVFLGWRAVTGVRPRQVTLCAEPAGLRCTGLGRPRFLPWHEIQAWGVFPATERHPDPVFAVFWPGNTLTWQEPSSTQVRARQAAGPDALHAAAQALHALILVRANQPLRDLSTEPARLSYQRA